MILNVFVRGNVPICTATWFSSNVRTTAPMATMASKLPLLAMAFATTGSSKEPGTQTTCRQATGGSVLPHARLLILAQQTWSLRRSMHAMASCTAKCHKGCSAASAPSLVMEHNRLKEKT